jgi:tetratricopeptide (TPR) repeat protein
MLFDLRGRGRRNTIKVIYITLALLMGGGLVLFGIGGEVSGGLVDAITDPANRGDTSEERFEQREADALARTRANPEDTQAWLELVRACVSLAGAGDRYNQAENTYNAEGQAKLREAAAAWERLLELEPDEDEELSRVASLMVRGYVALNDFEGAAIAQEIVAEVRESAGTYSQLAILAYQAGQTRKGDLASDRAIELTEPDMRETLRSQLEQAKQQSALEGIEGAAGEPGAEGGGAGGGTGGG